MEFFTEIYRMETFVSTKKQPKPYCMQLEKEAIKDQLSKNERKSDIDFFFSRQILLPDYWFEADDPGPNEKSPED